MILFIIIEVDNMKEQSLDVIDMREDMKKIDARIAFLKREIKELSKDAIKNKDIITNDYLNLIKRLQQKIDLTDDSSKKDNLLSDLNIAEAKLKKFNEKFASLYKNNKVKPTFKNVDGQYLLMPSLLDKKTKNTDYEKIREHEKAMLLDTAGFMTSSITSPISGHLSFSGNVSGIECMIYVLPFQLVSTIKGTIERPNSKYSNLEINYFGDDLAKIIEDKDE